MKQRKYYQPLFIVFNHYSHWNYIVKPIQALARFHWHIITNKGPVKKKMALFQIFSPRRYLPVKGERGHHSFRCLLISNECSYVTRAQSNVCNPDTISKGQKQRKEHNFAKQSYKFRRDVVFFNILHSCLDMVKT